MTTPFNFSNTEQLTPENTNFSPQLLIETVNMEVNRGDEKTPDLIEAFPDQLQEIIKELDRVLLFNNEYITLSLLVASSTSIGNSYKLKVNNDWIEHSILYGAIVGNPGTNKTAPLSWAFKPIEREDNRKYLVYKDRYDLYEEVHKMSAKEKKANEEYYKLHEKEPDLERSLMNNFTIEALYKAHQANPKGLGVCVDELSELFGNFNRYNNGSDEQAYLSMWSGQSRTIDRKGSGQIRIEKPCVSVIGTLQTAILSEITGGKRSVNGFSHRMLFAFPEDIKVNPVNFEQISESFAQKWEHITRKLLSLKMTEYQDGPGYKLLFLNEEARAIFSKWEQEAAARQNLFNDSGQHYKSGVIAKMRTYLFRFSLILHLIEWACKESGSEIEKEIQADTVKRALILVEYFTKTSFRAHELGEKGDSYKVTKTSEKKETLLKALPLEFSTSQANEIGKGLGLSHATVKRQLKRAFDNEMIDKKDRGQWVKI